MTTFEWNVPDEPELGSVVVNSHGWDYVHEHGGWRLNSEYSRRYMTWPELLKTHGSLELVEHKYRIFVNGESLEQYPDAMNKDEADKVLIGLLVDQCIDYNYGAEVKQYIAGQEMVIEYGGHTNVCTIEKVD